MKKIFKTLNKYARAGVFILVRVFLYLVYLVVFLPFAVVVRLCCDYLESKVKAPYWIPLEKIENVKELLLRQ